MTSFSGMNAEVVSVTDSLTIEKKRQFLTERGWYPWYNDDYMCHPQFGINGQDETYRGMHTNEAYEFETDTEARGRTLKGMSLYFSALNALSKMGKKA